MPEQPIDTDLRRAIRELEAPLAIVLIVPMCLLASVTGLVARGLPIEH
jgi:hypothetical protein